jgi:hypothetical protein
MSLLGASLNAISAIGSHARTNFKEAVVLVENRRMELVSAALPYLFSGKEDVPAVRTETIDELFDQLDEIIAKEKAEKAEGENEDGVQNNAGSVEPTAGKLV